MIYPRYEAKIVFYKKRKPITYYYLNSSLSQLACYVRNIKRELKAGWYIIEKLELQNSLLDYETKRGDN